jgi:dihydroorotate dehydrogenase (fumarate)
MNLETKYLGLQLKNPLIMGASPLGDSLERVQALEEAGAAAIVLRSLFEEQIEMEERAFHHHVESHSGGFAEAAGGYLPPFTDFALDTDHYLEHLRNLKKRLEIPVIGSLNGVTPGGWESYARRIEEAGADALELNLYDLPADPTQDSLAVESRYIQIVKDLRSLIKIPLAVKLSPFYSSLPNFVMRLSQAGADGVVLFNRLYQPDIDIKTLQVKTALTLSDSSELALRLRWVAILEPHFQGSISVSGGVHTTADAIKALMTGATTLQMVSAIIRNGPSHFKKLEQEIRNWLDENEYESLDQLRGSMSLRTCPDPAAFGRSNYMRTLHGWSVLTAE